MRIKNFIFIAVLALSMTAKADEIKRPDSYNYQKGCEAATNGRFEEGMKYLKTELQANPQNGYVWAWILYTHVGLQEWDKGIEAGQKALKLLPHKDSQYIGFVHSTLSKLYDNMDDEDKALSEINLAVKADPQNIDYVAIRADLYYYNEEYAKANMDFEKIISTNPGHPTGYIGMGRNLLAQKKYDAAIEKFNYAITLDANLSQPYAFRADCYLNKREYVLAAQDIVKALEIDANDRAFAMMVNCHDSCYKNLVLLMNVKAVEASDDNDWDYLLGVTHQTHNHFKDAIICYQKSNEREPYSNTYEHIAECYGEQGDYQRALQNIEKAIAMDSSNNDLYRQEADYHYYAGECDKAIATMDKYISNNPKFAWGYYRRGFYKDNIRDIDGALYDYTYCICLDPTYAYAYLGRGDMYRAKGNLEAARKDYQMVVALDTIISDEGNCRQYGYLMLGQKENADAYMQKILNEYPTAENYYDATCLTARMGEYRRSLEYLKLAFEKGYHEIKHIEQDDDLEAIRKLPEYKALIEKYKH